MGRRAARHGHALTVLLVVTRLLPVAVQAVLVVTALLSRSWVLAIMSATSLAMSVATAVQSLVALRLRGVPSGGPAMPGGKGDGYGAADPAALSPAPGRPDGITEADASRCAIVGMPLSRLLTAGTGTSAPYDDDHAGPSDLALWRRCVRSWYSGRQETGMLRVPIGTGADGQTCLLDLVRDGPHALVAGTTGSGKSVLLEGWCAALALSYPPSRLNFVFLDFKGGATFRDLRRLPHTAGSVSDLSLGLARRALDGLERELRRRERLLADHDVDRLDLLGTPPPRLVVVVDEFNALRTSLPDYLPRLARIASQGRSLGIHLVLSTQSPSSEVPRTMQANIGTDICLRVRDPLQSSDLVGTHAAAWLRSDRPGTAILRTGGGLTLLRAAVPPRRCVDICSLAARFLATAGGAEGTGARRLFTDPLPRVCRPADIAARDPAAQAQEQAQARAQAARARVVSPDAAPLCIGLADDGVMTFPAVVDPARGNIAVCGPSGRGKSAFCSLVRRLAPWVHVADDADGLLDPLADTAGARHLRRLLEDRKERTVYAVRDPRHVRYPAQCATRVFFPTGDKAADMLAGIPAQALAGWEPEDLSCPGRAVVCDGSGWTTVQITAPDG